MNENEMTPQQYFEFVKDKKHSIDSEQLMKIYHNCFELYKKYKITGQDSGIKKLFFHMQCIEKEMEIINMGVNTFVYRDDIEFYIDNIASDVVKIIELENYEREIPDEIVEVISKVKDKFDQLYIVFTDYTGDIERQVQKERIDKDPILFGTFQDKESRSVIDRFYYLGDWVDEYCTLTLDKMVNETKKVGNRNISHEISLPKDLEELKQQLNAIQKDKNGEFKIVEYKPKFLSKVKTFFSRWNKNEEKRRLDR